jgi:hypothetical protein
LDQIVTPGFEQSPLFQFDRLFFTRLRDDTTAVSLSSKAN